MEPFVVLMFNMELSSGYSKPRGPAYAWFLGFLSLPVSGGCELCSLPTKDETVKYMVTRTRTPDSVECIRLLLPIVLPRS